VLCVFPLCSQSCCTDLSHQHLYRTGHPAWTVKADEQSRLGNASPHLVSTGSIKEANGGASTKRNCAGDPLVHDVVLRVATSIRPRAA